MHLQQLFSLLCCGFILCNPSVPLLSLCPSLPPVLFLSLHLFIHFISLKCADSLLLYPLRLVSQSHTISSGPAKQLDEIFVWGPVRRFLPLGDNFNQTWQKDVFMSWQTQRGRQTEEEGAESGGEKQNLELVKLLCCDSIYWNPSPHSWCAITVLPLSFIPDSLVCEQILILPELNHGNVGQTPSH